MPESLLLAPILLPLALGAITPLLRGRGDRFLRAYTMLAVLLTSACAWALILCPPAHPFAAIKFAHNLSIAFRMDGFSRVFAGLVATLWPLSTLYGFEYMRADPRQNSFFTFYTMTFGITLGIALADDLLTLYVFYEMLTFVTLPLVMHAMTKRAVHAGRKYLYYSLAGSACVLIGLIFIIYYGGTTRFISGGALFPAALGGRRDLLRAIYLITFFGFGVKAAVFPVHAWLPTAAVAPTPVTALLHAVAVVKSGVFAILRVTVFCFGAALLRGSWAQYAVICVAAFSIVYGSSLALKETHLKRRLAYSTVANLSYVILGVTMLTPAGLTAAMLHLLAHAVMKIGAFFCAGTITMATGREYVTEMEGVGRKMKLVCACFVVFALSLTGIPPMAGFVSKWYLASSAIAQGSPYALGGAGALLISALLTCMYMFTSCVPMFFPRRESAPVEIVWKPTWQSLLPIALFAAATIALGLFAGPLVSYLDGVTSAVLGGVPQ